MDHTLSQAYVYLVTFLKFSHETNFNYTSKFLKKVKDLVRLDIFLLTLKQNHDRFQDDISKSLLKGFLVEYEIASKIHAKYQYLFNLLSEVKNNRSDELEKCFWLIIIYLKQVILNKNNKTIDILLLIVSVLLKCISKFPLSKGIIYNEDNESGECTSYSKLMTMMLKNLAFSDNDSNREVIEGYISLVSREFEKLGLNEFLNITAGENSLEEMEMEKLVNQRVIIRMMNEYENTLGNTQFNECLLLSFVLSDKSPVKGVGNFYLDKPMQNELIRQKLDFSEQSKNVSCPHGNLEELKVKQVPASPMTSYMFNAPNKSTTNYQQISSSPFGGANNFQMFTPITRVVSMNKWICQYTKNFQPKYLHTFYGEENQNILPILCKKINDFAMKVFDLLTRYSVKLRNKPEDLNLLCFKLIEGLLKKNQATFKVETPQLKLIIEKEEFLKAIVTIAFEIVLYVENIQDIFFYKITQAIQLDVFILLKVINPIMTFDLMNVSINLLFI